MMMTKPLGLFCAMAAGGMLATGMVAAPALGQSGPERGVFITQIGEGSRAEVSQNNADSLAQIVQDGRGNQVDLAQTGDARHRAQIAQDGDSNIARARQEGEGSAELALVQDGNGNIAILAQREDSAVEVSSAAVLQRGNGNSLLLTQNGSDNQASLQQLGNDNTMSASQEGSGNRLQWAQHGDGLSDLGIAQTGGGNLQITQSSTGAQFAPPPGSGG